MIWDTSIWRLGCSNRSKIRLAQKCYLCLRYAVSPMSPGWTESKWWAWVALNHRPRPYQYCGPWSRTVILRDTGCGPARQSKADALARVATTRGRGASKEQQVLACLGTQAERPRFQGGILEGMLGHSRNPSPTSSTLDLPYSNARRAPNRWHPRVSRRRLYPLRNPPHEG